MNPNQEQYCWLEVVEKTVELEAGVAQTVDFQGMEDAGEQVVLVESSTKDVQVELDGPVEPVAETEGATALARFDAKNFGVTVSSAVRATVRITVGFFRTKIKKFWDNLPCESCIAAVKLLIGVLLVYVGVPLIEGPDPDDLPINLTDEERERMEELLSDDKPLPNILRRLLDSIPQQIIDAFKQVGKAFGWIFDARGKFATLVCQKVGMCP